MARSLLRQLEQIRRAATYDDAIANVNTAAVAEPVISGSLEEDTNVIRSIMKQFKGTTNWYDTPGLMFDPTTTNSGGDSLVDYNMENVRGHSLRNKSVIIAVEEDNSGSGYTVSGTSTGTLATISTRYAGQDGGTDWTGLPIYASTANAGQYHDEGGSSNVCRVDVLDMSSGQEFDDGTDIIYAMMYDGADFGGAGAGTDVYFRFYKNGNPCDLTGTGVTSVAFVYPQRKRMSDVQEWEWLRTDFVSSWEGDVELTEDISNLWSFTGSSDNTSAPTWTNSGGNWSIGAGTVDLEGGINDLNSSVGDMTFTEDNYITDGWSVAASLDALDQAIKDNADAISAASAAKYVESLSAQADANTVHALPAGVTYTPDATAGQEGKNMDVFVDGQLLAADTGANGVNADRDYGETTASGITFRFNVQAGRNVTYLVRQ